MLTIHSKGLLATIKPGLLKLITRYLTFDIVWLFDTDIKNKINDSDKHITNSKIYLLSGPEFIPLEKEDLNAILVAAT